MAEQSYTQEEIAELKRINVVFNTTWRFMKKRVPELMRLTKQSGEEFWPSLVVEAGDIPKQTEDEKFCRSIIITCLEKLEDLAKERGV